MLGNSLLTTLEAAEFLRIEKRTLENWRVSGRGPSFVRLGGAVRYKIVALEKFISENERYSTVKA
ncbi:MAG: DNA-binding protein [Alphaproteobacteria bacterium]|nr:DNA-binding protein [Alphaproteobacteria bacterium]NDC55906.1 DNA-binding protein [Alphaproteobacteria bacterium]NDG26935.1 DNA-binding protein [Pseudomonadota bacterium]